MTGRTENYALSTIEDSGDGTLSDDGFKYTNADRVLIDRLLFGSTSHHHIGGTNEITTPTDAPELTLFSDGGTIQAGIRVYYKYTLVDENGFESAASAEATVDTPAQIATPGAPTLTHQATTGGTLLPGSYYYVMSAYSGGVTTQETRAGSAAQLSVPAGTSTNVIRVTFPSLPADATGWNIYAKRPGSTQYYFLTSIDMDVATPDIYYDDTGATIDPARVSPLVNTTLSTNSVDVAFPGSTPAVPAGYTWKIYRTFILNNYNSSLLHWVVEETTPGTVDAEYLDTGIATASGSPPTSSQSVDNPEKVLLTDATEAQGYLPMKNVIGFPFVATFLAQGPLTVAQIGVNPWRCPFPSAVVVRIEAQLGYDLTAAATPSTTPRPTGSALTCNVWRNRAADSWSHALATDITAGALVIPANNHHKELTYAQLTATTLVQGDLITVDVGKDNGGYAESCTVNVVMIASFTAATSDTTLWA